MLAHQVILPALATLLDKHPQLQVDLLIGLPTLDVARRQADIAVRIPRPTDSNLVCRKLGEFGVAVYASRRYLASHGKPKRGMGLRGHSLISFTDYATPTFGMPFQGESLEGTSGRDAYDGHAFAQMKAVADGIGISELPAVSLTTIRNLSAFGRTYGRRCARFGWSSHQDLRRAAKIRLVSNAIVEAFEREAAILRYGRPRKRRLPH